MREIKFRAKYQDPVTKKHGDWQYWTVLKDCMCDLIVYSKIDKDTLCQYTGLKDANGVEIYEGDIVEQEAVRSYPGEYGEDIDRLYIGKVVILPSKGACLSRPNVIERNGESENWKCAYYKNIASYRSKVVGNAFENPELLKG